MKSGNADRVRGNKRTIRFLYRRTLLRVFAKDSVDFTRYYHTYAYACDEKTNLICREKKRKKKNGPFFSFSGVMGGRSRGV